MKAQIAVVVAVTVAWVAQAAPSGPASYDVRPVTTGYSSPPTYGGGSTQVITTGHAGSVGGGYGGGSVGGGYGGGPVRTSKRVYLFAAPQRTRVYRPAPALPPAKERVNIILIRAPEGPDSLPPLVAPADRERNIIYVLSQDEEEAQRVIKAPSAPNVAPEVYYLNYKKGDNPVLHDGTYLQNALTAVGGHGGSGGYGEIVPEITQVSDGGYGGGVTTVVDTGYGASTVAETAY